MPLDKEVEKAADRLDSSEQVVAKNWPYLKPIWIVALVLIVGAVVLLKACG
jgi:hypothetical protein